MVSVAAPTPSSLDPTQHLGHVEPRGYLQRCFGHVSQVPACLPLLTVKMDTRFLACFFAAFFFAGIHCPQCR